MPGEPDNEVTRLFDEYVDAREASLRPDPRAFADRAGAHRDELLERIDAYESIEGMAAELDGRPLEETFGRYAIRSLIGAGGLGEVYLAHDPTLDRAVALKVLDRARAGLREARIVLNEARALARLEHPGIVRVFEVGEVDGRAYVSMEYLDAPSLSEVLAAMRRRAAGTAEGEVRPEVAELAARLESTSERTLLLRRIAEALAYSHDRGVLHRDVKPSNVLLGRDGQPRLIDFGLAHVDDGGEDARADFTQRFVGTAAYAAPEQIDAQRTGDDPRSDQFAFGSLAYEVYALENPFQRPTHTATLDAVSTATPPPLRQRVPALPRDLDRIVHHCLERAAEDRYPDLDAVAADLQAVLDHVPIALAEPTLSHALHLWSRRHRRALRAGTVLAAATLLVALGSAWVDGARERRAILGEVSGLEVAGLASPRDFEAGYETLKGAQVAAQRNAARRLVLGAGALPAVDEAVRAWSARLAEVLEAQVEQSASEGITFQHGEWSRIVELERDLCPDCTANAASRGRAVVRLPADLGDLEYSFFEEVPLSEEDFYTVPTYRRIPFVDRPVVGEYRLLLWDPSRADGVDFEIDFRVARPWEPERTLELRPRRREVWERARPVPAGRVVVNGGDAPEPGIPASIRAGAFRITPEPVSRPAFEAFLRDTGRPHDFRYVPDNGPGAPAWVGLEDARAYCRWAGGRLPSSVELVRAYRERTVTGLTPGPHGFGEWIDDQMPLPGAMPTTFSYPRFQTHLEETWTSPVVMRTVPGSSRPQREQDGALVGILFRVAFTTDRDLAHH